MDGEGVRGFLHLPDTADDSEAGVPLVVVVHGWSGDKIGPYRFFVETARALAEDGYAVCRFDFRGSGDSDGDFEDQTQTRMLTDLNAVIDQCCADERIDDACVALVGHSQGGYVSLLHAARDSRVSALVLWMARTSDLTDWYGQPWRNQIEDHGYWEYDGYKITRTVWEDSKQYSVVDAFQELVVPIGMIYGRIDQVVPLAEADRVEHAVDAPVEKEVIETLDHYFTGDSLQDRVLEQTKDWLDTWLKSEA